MLVDGNQVIHGATYVAFGPTASVYGRTARPTSAERLSGPMNGNPSRSVDRLVSASIHLGRAQGAHDTDPVILKRITPEKDDCGAPRWLLKLFY